MDGMGGRFECAGHCGGFERFLIRGIQCHPSNDDASPEEDFFQRPTVTLFFLQVFGSALGPRFVSNEHIRGFV